MSDLPAAKLLLEEAAADCGKAKKKADAHGQYVAALAAADGGLTALSNHAQTAAVTKETEDIQKQIDAAKKKVKADDYPGALTLLEEAQKDCAKAKNTADIHANLKTPIPNKKLLALLAKEPGGHDALDKVVDSLGDDASSNVLMAALNARFDCKMVQFFSKDKNVHTNMKRADKSAPDKSVKQIYKLLQKVPETHARDNPKVKTIKRFTEETGGAAYGGGQIFMNCGRAGPGGSNDQGKELKDKQARYFPDGVDGDCEPANDDSVTYFDWATLHEVGHAVDDKKGFMTKNGKEPAYGGWKDYGNDCTKAAEAAQGKFGYDLVYIKAKLNGGTPAAVAHPKTGQTPVPTPQELTDWDEAKKKVDEWCVLVSSQNLWWNGAGSKKAAISNGTEDIVYQKAYDTKWVSYRLEARKQGIHGYQFRAPGEWFAELYAAYYSDKLKDTHPAVSWLDTL